MSGLKLDSATIESLNTCTSYPPCSSPFPKVKVISGSSSTINIFLGAKLQNILLFYYFSFFPFTRYQTFYKSRQRNSLFTKKLLINALHGTWLYESVTCGG